MVYMNHIYIWSLLHVSIKWFIDSSIDNPLYELSVEPSIYEIEKTCRRHAVYGLYMPLHALSSPT
jgi:hypothetical protein